MVKNKEFVDYLILIQLVVAIFFVILSHNKYEYVTLYFSFMIFVSYWLIKVVFRKIPKED